LDGQRLDAFTRTFALSRRRAAKTALGAVLAAVGAGAVDAKDTLVGICHRTGKAPDAYDYISVSPDAVAAHRAHGDIIAPDFANDPANCGGCARVPDPDGRRRSGGLRGRRVRRRLPAGTGAGQQRPMRRSGLLLRQRVLRQRHQRRHALLRLATDGRVLLRDRGGRLLHAGRRLSIRRRPLPAVGCPGRQDPARVQPEGRGRRDRRLPDLDAPLANAPMLATPRTFVHGRRVPRRPGARPHRVAPRGATAYRKRHGK
jgi:hypothetical protein